MFRAVALALTLLVWWPAAVAGAQTAPFRVVVDAGHGGSDPGAISPVASLTEKTVTLRLALLTGAALERRGVAVVYTRTDDRYVALAERAALAEGSGASALLSLHLNSAPDPAVSGAEAWYGSGARDADLAGALLAGLGPVVRDYRLSLRGTRPGGGLAVLRSSVPSALVELGYVTNASEAALLQQPAFLARLADGLAAGVVRFRDGGRSPAVPAQAPGRTAVQGALPLTDLYFIRPGDTLGSIAARFRTATADLVRLNPVYDTQRLLPGAPLQVPVTAGDTVVAAWAGSSGTSASRTTQRGTVSGSAVQGIHTVSAGETLGGIALRYGVTTGELAAWNGITDPRRLLVGQRLLLRSGVGPSVAGAPAGTPGRRYVVQPGDTLSEIAQRNGVSLTALRAANSSRDANLVVVGTALIIPARG